MARRVKAEVSAFCDFLTADSISTFSCMLLAVYFCRAFSYFLFPPPFPVPDWNVNEILCKFRPPKGGTLSLTVSVPDEYPDVRPICFCDDQESGLRVDLVCLFFLLPTRHPATEPIVLAANDYASNSDASLTQILHQVFSCALITELGDM
jgi:hypothetical protein